MQNCGVFDEPQQKKGNGILKSAYKKFKQLKFKAAMIMNGGRENTIAQEQDK